MGKKFYLGGIRPFLKNQNAILLESYAQLEYAIRNSKLLTLKKIYFNYNS